MRKKIIITFLCTFLCIAVFLLFCHVGIASSKASTHPITPANSYTYSGSADIADINEYAGYLIQWDWAVDSIIDGLTYSFYYKNQQLSSNSILPADRVIVSYSPVDQLYNLPGDDSVAGIMSSLLNSMSFNFEIWIYCNGDEIYNGVTKEYVTNIYESYSWTIDLSETIANSFAPLNYNFSNDRYSFRNFSEAIPQKYYTETFDTIKGNALYSDSPNLGQGGHCFGMAISTIATLVGAPSVTDYISFAVLPYQKLSSVNKGTSNIDLGMTAKEYIKCCHVYQRSYEVQEQRNSASHQGIQNVYNAVLAGIDSSQTTGIAIDLWGGPGGHTVYACGIDGNDILIDDSNSPTQTRIHVNGNTWSYSGGGFSWSSASGCTINYVDSFIVPYLRIVASVRPSDIVLSDGSVVTGYTEASELDGSFELWNYNIADKVDQGRCLAIVPDGDFDLSNASDFLKIETTDGGNDSESNAYWLKDEANSIEANNISETSSEIILASDDLSITASVPAKATTQMSVGDYDYVNMDCNQGDSIELTITTESADGDLVDLIITGTANNEHIDVSMNKNKIEAQGISNGNVILKHDDNIIKEKEFDKADANIEIFYDNSGTNDILEVSDNGATHETPTNSDNPTGEQTGEKCQYCDTVHPNTFVGKLTKFFHSILYFFAHLFGKM